MEFVLVTAAAAVVAAVSSAVAVKGWWAAHFLVFVDGLFSLAGQLVEALVPCF